MSSSHNAPTINSDAPTPSVWQRVIAAPGAVWRGVKATPSAIVYGARLAVWGAKTGAVFSVRETIYWLRLFLYTSKRYLRVETYLSLIGALVFFGYIISNDMARSQLDLLKHTYLYFTIVMVWLASSLLPREREERTLEILWSQPMGRGPMVTLQLITLTIWITALCAGVIAFFSQYSSYQEGKWTILLCVSSTAFAVGAVTVLISTFTRHVIATALVALLVFGVHYYWLTELGPLSFYPFPIHPPGYVPPRWGAPKEPSLWLNRTVLIVMVGFVLDYLYRRLKRTAEWVT
ncbi:MAG: ABC transporter permease subunit [Candidatus Hinthialibacter antarcticus]|nr:ABC transporter permease subunit [Candidatus Hinthialibacter antarcticus]